MDKLIEIEVVKTFFNKNYYDRVIYELSSKNKRNNALSRLCHNYESLLNCNYMKKVSYSYCNEVLDKMKSSGAPELCYVISYNKMVDGTHMRLEEALKTIVGYGMPSLVVCVPNRLVYFESEQFDGAPPRYILER